MNRKLMIYLDTCIWGRFFDNMASPEVRADVAAIKNILYKCRHGGHIIVGSKTVLAEIGKISNATIRVDIEALYRKSIQGEATLTADGIKRTQYLETQGLGAMDAQHLATAESVGADFLLTVDKFFIKRCNDLNLTIVGVMNPTNFINGGYLK